MDRLVNFLESLGETMVLGNSVQTWLVCTLIVVAGVLLTRLARFLFSRYLPKLAQLSETELDDYIVEGAIGPLAAMVLLPALHVAAHILDMPAGIRKLCEHAVAIAFALLVTMVAVRAVDALFRHGLGPWKTRDGKHLDPQVIAFGRKFSKVLIIAIAGIIVLQRVGLDVLSLITGLGIGGLAVALAAQQTLGNVLGSLQIMTDQPFRVGDYVRVDGAFGQVQEVGLRSTKLLTATGVVVIVPNKHLAETTIENCSAHQGITVAFTIGVVYETTADEIDKVTEALRSIVSAQAAVHPQVKVYFHGYGASSLDMQVIYSITDFKQHLQTRHQINLDIKRRFDEEGWQFAFPTRTVHVVKEDA